MNNCFVQIIPDKNNMHIVHTFVCCVTEVWTHCICKNACRSIKMQQIGNATQKGACAKAFWKKNNSTQIKQRSFLATEMFPNLYQTFLSSIARAQYLSSMHRNSWRHRAMLIPTLTSLQAVPVMKMASEEPREIRNIMRTKDVTVFINLDSREHEQLPLPYERLMATCNTLPLPHSSQQNKRNRWINEDVIRLFYFCISHMFTALNVYYLHLQKQIMVLGDSNLLFCFRLTISVHHTIVKMSESGGSTTINCCRQVPSLSFIKEINYTYSFNRSK